VQSLGKSVQRFGYALCALFLQMILFALCIALIGKAVSRRRAISCGRLGRAADIPMSLA
jgi:hypothetical protein